MEHKKLLHNYDRNITDDEITNRKNSDESLFNHCFNLNPNNGQYHTPPYVNSTNNKPTLFSNNRKKRKWDDMGSEQTTVPICVFEDQQRSRYTNGMSSRSDDGTYRRLHEHVNEDDDDDDNYDSSSPEWNTFQKNSKNGSYKLIFLICILLFFLMMYIPVYNQANSRTPCGKNCHFLSKYINFASILSSESNVNATVKQIDKSKLDSIHSKLKRIKFFERLWSSRNKGSVPGWSYNTSRDTRNYVLPDNVTLLNQPKSVCKLKRNNENVYKSNRGNKNEKAVKDRNEIFLLVIICSSMEHFEARSAIRETWGNQTNYELLARRIQNVTKQYKNVNVTEKMLNDFNNVTNIIFTDKRIKRDLDSVSIYGFDIDAASNSNISENERDNSKLGMSILKDNFDKNSISNVELNLNKNVTPSRPNRLDKMKNVTFVDDQKKSINYESLMNFNNADERTKREVKTNDGKESVSKNFEEARFDYGDNGPDHTATYTDDSKILGNFEENDSNRNDIDFYDYQTEVSNIMRIPPRGEKYLEDDNMGDAKDHVNKVLKLSISDEKLKLESLPIKDLHVKKKNNSVEKNVESKKHSLPSKIDESNNSNKGDPPVRVKFLFLLGQWANENNTDLQAKIDEEAATYGDIIQEGFIDSYNNLTLKSVMLLKWVVSNCGDNVRYVMKTDDDMYINIPRLIEALKNKSNEYLQQVAKSMKIEHVEKINSTLKSTLLKDEKLLMGNLICDAKPISDTNSKWYSPTYMFGGKVYPRYLSGTGYVMSLATAKLLYRAALDTPLFHLEDIYITGMCSLKSGIKPMDHPGFSYLVRKFHPCVYAYLITAHQVTPSQLRKMHHILTDIPTILEGCEMKHLLSKKNVSLLTNMKDLLSKVNSPLSLGSPKSFINGLVNLGVVDNKGSKLGIAKKRKRPNNGCF